MEFHVEHHFSSPAVEVMGAMVDSDLYSSLQFPDLSRPEVLSRTSEGGHTSLQVRYTFIGNLDSLGRRLVGTERLSWIQEIEIDMTALGGRLSFASEDRSRRLHGEAKIAFHQEGDGTARKIDGRLVVAVRFVGAAVERRIVAGLLRDLDLEAQAIREQLEGA